MPTSPRVLSVEGLSKTFPGQRALSSVSLDVHRGEVHALVGENGSGKSTLIKCLAGVHVPDDGARIEIGGQEVSIPYTSAEAIRLGCGFIHQDLGLIPTLSVLENIALSHGFSTRLGRIRWRAEAARTRELLHSFAPDISPNTRVSHLAPSQRTLVAIARGLQDASLGGRLLVLDEPTASLPSSEVSVLFDALRRLARTGVGIIYVSHRLGEVFQLADRVTVLRDGRNVGTWDTSALDERTLIEKIVGRPLENYYPSVEDTATGEVLLRVKDLCGHRVRNATFTVGRGEIVGVAGLLASGRSELMRLIFGAQRPTAGSIEINGSNLVSRSPADAIRAGIALVPEDRRGGGSHSRMTIRENITLANARAHASWGRVRRGAERREVIELLDRFDVRPRDPDRVFATLSGGNQQKAILAKWLRLNPQLLILDEPVQGVDIGATIQIYEMLERAAADGMGVLMVDSELEDLCRLCDRVLVLRNGRIVQQLAGSDKTRDRILELILRETETS